MLNKSVSKSLRVNRRHLVHREKCAVESWRVIALTMWKVRSYS